MGGGEEAERPNPGGGANEASRHPGQRLEGPATQELADARPALDLQREELRAGPPPEVPAAEGAVEVDAGVSHTRSRCQTVRWGCPETVVRRRVRAAWWKRK